LSLPSVLSRALSWGVSGEPSGLVSLGSLYVLPPLRPPRGLAVHRSSVRGSVMLVCSACRGSGSDPYEIGRRCYVCSGMGLIPETLEDYEELVDIFGWEAVDHWWSLREVLEWRNSRKSTPLSGGGSRRDSSPRSSEIFSSGFRSNRGTTPVQAQKGGEHNA